MIQVSIKSEAGLITATGSVEEIAQLIERLNKKEQIHINNAEAPKAPPFVAPVPNKEESDFGKFIRDAIKKAPNMPPYDGYPHKEPWSRLNWNTTNPFGMTQILEAMREAEKQGLNGFIGFCGGSKEEYDKFVKDMWKAGDKR